MNEHRSSDIRRTERSQAALPVFPEEPYRVIQAEENALVGIPWAGGRMLRFLSQHMVLLQIAALLLGALFGLALLWILSFWMY